MGVSENRGYLILGPYNKDPTIYGTILGSPIFGNSHIRHLPKGPRYSYAGYFKGFLDGIYRGPFKGSFKGSRGVLLWGHTSPKSL